MSAEARVSPWTSFNIKFSLNRSFLLSLRITNLFHATKWLFICTFTCFLIPCNIYRIARGWRHLLHQKSVQPDWCTQPAKSFLCFSSSSVVLDFQSIFFLLSSFFKRFSWSITQRRWKQSKSITKPSWIFVCYYVLENIGLRGYIWSVQYSYDALSSPRVNPDFSEILTYCIQFTQWTWNL